MTKLLIFCVPVEPNVLYMFVSIIDLMLAVGSGSRALGTILLVKKYTSDKPEKEYLYIATALKDIFFNIIWICWNIFLLIKFSSHRHFTTYAHKLYFYMKYIYIIALAAWYILVIIGALEVIVFAFILYPILVVMFMWNKQLLDVIDKDDMEMFSDNNDRDIEKIPSVNNKSNRFSIKSKKNKKRRRLSSNKSINDNKMVEDTDHNQNTKNNLREFKDNDKLSINKLSEDHLNAHNRKKRINDKSVFHEDQDLDMDLDQTITVKKSLIREESNITK